MQVEIFSVHAALRGGGPTTWKGEVSSVRHFYHANTDEKKLDILFRLFNRVSYGDNERLNEWRYRLPSLSMGDYITFQGRTYRVEAFGFTKITGNEEEMHLLMPRTKA
jgi:hypothetical protein